MPRARPMPGDTFEALKDLVARFGPARTSKMLGFHPETTGNLLRKGTEKPVLNSTIRKIDELALAKRTDWPRPRREAFTTETTHGAILSPDPILRREVARLNAEVTALKEEHKNLEWRLAMVRFVLGMGQ